MNAGNPIIKVNKWEKSDRKAEVRALIQELAPAVVKAVEDSFREANMKSPTTAEVKLRTETAWAMAKMMRWELKWSKFRIVDLLLPCLRQKLLGVEPDYNKMAERSSW